MFGNDKAAEGLEQFVAGAPVYDVNGEEVGAVSEHGVRDDALVVHQGILHDNVYVPLGLIRSADAAGVHLTISNDDMAERQWSALHADSAVVPPSEREAGE